MDPSSPRRRPIFFRGLGVLALERRWAGRDRGSLRLVNKPFLVGPNGEARPSAMAGGQLKSDQGRPRASGGDAELRRHVLGGPGAGYQPEHVPLELAELFGTECRLVGDPLAHQSAQLRPQQRWRRSDKPARVEEHPPRPAPPP